MGLCRRKNPGCGDCYRGGYAPGDRIPGDHCRGDHYRGDHVDDASGALDAPLSEISCAGERPNDVGSECGLLKRNDCFDGGRC